MHSAPLIGWKASHSAKAIAVVSVILLISACSNHSASVLKPIPIAQSATENFDSLGTFNNMSAADWQAALTPLFNEARETVQRETKTNLGDVTFSVVSNKVIEREVAAETGRLTHSQFTEKRFADQFLNSVMEGQIGTYAALYSTRNKGVMVSDSLLKSYMNSVGNDATAIKHALSALLIHELVHAADDARYNIHQNRDLSFRASFAQSAIYEGHAQYITRKICQQSDCLPGLASLDNFMSGNELAPNELAQPVQAISRNILEYSYIEGERFISGLAKRSDGQSLIQSALNAPPRDPVQILDPSSYPNSTRTDLNKQLIEASKNVAHPWNTRPWVSVEASPLKGVNLRGDPARRVAAVDGFTRLLRAMVAIQHYDQSDFNASPVEVTLMSADSSQTAEMFAQSLSSNLIYNSDGQANEEVIWLSPELDPESVIAVDTPLKGGQSHLALVVSHQQFVLQLVAVDVNRQEALDYAKAVLSNLSTAIN